MDQLNLNTTEIASIALNGENFVAKAKNTVAYLREQFDAIKPESDKARELHSNLEKVLVDLEENVSPKIDTVSVVSAEMKQQIESLEDSDAIFAAARASFTEASKSTRVKPTR